MQLSVFEINNRLYGEPDGQGARPFKHRQKELPFRYLPREIVQTSRDFLNKTGDVGKVLRYIENSFYIYRECVNRGFFAPHYEVDNVYEWPKPAEFSWSDIETIISGGEFLYGKIPSEKKEL